AGPSAGGMGGFGGGGRGGPGGGPGGMRPPTGNQQGTGTGAGMPPTGGQQGQPRPGTSQQGQQQGRQPGGMPGMPGAGERFRGAGGRGGGGGMGGLLNGASVDAAARKLLTADADAYTWSAAAIGSQNAASYQLATGDPVMAIGGFNGSDPSPTLAQFKKYVEDGRIHYFISSGDGGEGGGGGMGGMGGSSGTSSKISTWVEANFTKVTAGSATFYDLTRPKTKTETMTKTSG
ncbi:glycosyl transferase, partial [Streptomyces sp. SID11233]|nr:glycosyl transferase [Streptomyces sp. SID11233]